jgi:ABC-type oligopeptide transport system ATPase subunit
MTKIINLIGSSGSGKSTTASALFAKMKMERYKVELIYEVAKGYTWSEHFDKLKNQALLLGKQSYLQDRLIDKVDYAITDSPLILSTVYTRPDYPESIKKFAIDLFNSYDNINFFIKRVKPFVKLGRNETELESDQIAQKIIKILDFHLIPYVEINGDENAPSKIFEYIKRIK